MALSHSHLHHPDLDTAADEVLDNATRLYLAGYFAEAQAMTERLLQPGPWRVDRHRAIMSRVAMLLPIFCWANGQGCPELPDQPARTSAELARWAMEENERELDDLVMINGGQTRAAGAKWSEEYFASLPELPRIDGIYRQYDEFTSDVHVVLRDRLRRRLDRPVPRSGQGLVVALASLEVSIAPRAEQFDHQQLSDMLAQCGAAIGRPPTWNEERSYIIASALDLLRGDVTAAALHLRRLMKLGAHVNVALILSCWPPLRYLLGDHVLADVLGVDDAAVADYTASLASRRSAALVEA